MELDLGSSVVLVGPANSGKPSALQALALWDLGSRHWAEKRDHHAASERTGVPINRRDLYALPVPSARLLWRDLHTHATGREIEKPVTKRVPIVLESEGLSHGHAWKCRIVFKYGNEESFSCQVE